MGRRALRHTPAVARFTRAPTLGIVKTFDQRYFDKWYRNPAHVVRSRSGVLRHAALALGVAEYLLERPLRRVLDVGCGEGIWERALRRLRPHARYTGIEPSAYAVGRYGGRRNIQHGTFGDLGDRDDIESYDLVVCVDVLHYLERDEVRRGAAVLGDRLNGVALLHAFAQGDEIEGDLAGLRRRPARWYRDVFTRAGLRAAGVACWVGEPLSGTLSALERGDAGVRST